LAPAARQREAEELDVAGVGFDQTECEAQRGGLPSAIGSEQAEALAGMQLEIDATYDFVSRIGLAHSP
jgi:hypothetical protein